MTLLSLSLALMFLPPLAAAAAGGLSLYLGDKMLTWKQVQGLTVGAAGVAFLGALLFLAGRIADPAPATAVLGTWFTVGGARADFAFVADPLAAVMAALVAGLGFVIARFSVNYMHNEPGFTRYFATYALFLVAMLVLVTADNLVLMFLGWEGVGVCSYLLIGQYTQRPAAGRAATEAFVANRVGDAGFLMAVVILLTTVGTVRFADLGAALAGAEAWVAPAVAFCLFVAAVGKSAQLPLGGWITKAMEGPTPSSALIHAATMVTAGVYLVVRAHEVFDAAPAILMLVALVGAATAMAAVAAGQTSSDIKGILANSTVMHLGLMFVACGLGAYALAIFYVVAHAFFKSYKFLTAPSILHHLHGTLDPEAAPSAAPVPSGPIAVLAVAAALILAPPVMALAGAPFGWGAATLVLGGAALLAFGLLAWLAARAAEHALDHGHGHGHAAAGSHVHDHDHGPGHGHPDADTAPHAHDAAADAGQGLGPAGGATLTVGLAALGGVVLQLVPAGTRGTWFGDFLALGTTDALSAAPGLGIGVSLMLGLMALHATLSVLFLSRATPERALAGRPVLRSLYAAVFNRFWIDAAIQSRLVPLVHRLSGVLARLDAMMARAAFGWFTRQVGRAGDAVGWLDSAPRRAAEGLPGVLGLHLSEAARAVEMRATEGVEEGIWQTTRSTGRLALVAERVLGRPAVSVAVIIAVTILALAGA